MVVTRRRSREPVFACRCKECGCIFVDPKPVKCPKCRSVNIEVVRSLGA